MELQVDDSFTVSNLRTLGTGSPDSHGFSHFICGMNLFQPDVFCPIRPRLVVHHCSILMKRHRISAVWFLVSIFLISSPTIRAQDTVVVQTLTYDSASRAGLFHFPENGSYEKVL